MPGPFIYQNNIPAANDELSVSQGDIQQNFASIESLINVDHDDFASVDAGKHAKVTFPRLGVVPSFSLTEFGLYNAPEIPVPNTLQLWVHNAGTGFDTPMTKSIFDTIPAPVLNSSGYSYLPSGLILQWGQFVNVATGATVNFNIPFPNQVITVISGKYVGGPAVYAIDNFLNASFQVTILTGANVSGTYIAIGY